MPPRRWSLESVSTVLVLMVALAVVLAVGLSLAWRAAADDLYASINQANGISLPAPRLAPAIWLSTRLASDVGPDDLTARRARADQLFYRSQRVQEMAAVGALVGLLVAVLSAGPGSSAGRRRDARSPAAKTASNGTV
jgi:hypothetical protein